jgi:ribokinase
MKKLFCVFGSINTDLVAQVRNFPRPGETITGSSFSTYFGGKGANQSVALARLGADIRIAGMVGDDIFGGSCRENFRDRGVDDNLVEEVSGCSTGVAVIEVDGSGENHIVIIPGANGRMDEAYLDRVFDRMLASDIFLFQLEIPMSTIMAALRRLKEHGKTVIIDPAPAPVEGLPEELFRLADIVTPNEHEASLLTGLRVSGPEEAERAARVLLDRGASAVIIKAGDKGAYVHEGTEFYRVSTHDIEVKDTTGAGDSFNAGLAFGLGVGYSLRDAVKLANAVGALACSSIGAQSAMPDFETVKAFLASHGDSL